MARKKAHMKEAYRTAGDLELYARQDEELGIAITVVQKRPGPFALNWRGILRGVLVVSLVLALLPLLIWLGARAYHLTTLLPKSWQPGVQAVIGLLAAVFVIFMVILHPIHIVRTFFGAGMELLVRIRDWRKRRRDQRDPDCLGRAVEEINAEMGWMETGHADENR